MHNTAECRRYNKDGTPMRGTFGQAARKSHEDSHPKKSYAQVLARMEKLEKSLKKANKKARNVTVAKKVTAILTHPEVLGWVVLGKMKIVVRKLKLSTS
eukprot:CCRYP_004980-RA/>CCRYP_004980-RA protein AED:0.38 eAED:0.38 QI:0/-1/0/1/-1/1/1/0/98